MPKVIGIKLTDADYDRWSERLGSNLAATVRQVVESYMMTITVGEGMRVVNATYSKKPKVNPVPTKVNPTKEFRSFTKEQQLRKKS